MTLGKITSDNSVRYVSKDSNSQSEQTKESDIKPYAIKNRKQNKSTSQNSKEVHITISGEGFRIIKWMMLC